MPRFSIIIPVYNIEKYLQECVDSVLMQSLQDFELILVDDGSSDESPTICDSYALNEQVHVIHKKNGGASSARNVGLNRAKGEYILFIDGDDYWNDVSALSNINKRIVEAGNDLILFRFVRRYDDGTKIITRKEMECVNELHVSNEEKINWLVKNQSVPGAAWSMCVKRSLIDETNISFKEGVSGEDFDWVIQLLSSSKNICCMNDAFYIYRMRDGSVTSTSKLSGVNGISYAIHRWFEIPKRILSMDAYVFQIFMVSLFGYKGLSVDERKIAKDILLNDSKEFKNTRFSFLFYGLKLIGPYTISCLLNITYAIRMKMLLKNKG